jgi:hypothetical protein
MTNTYYIVRTNRAGVFFGEIKERSATEITMTNVRKLWRWDGACAVEELAINGVKKPSGCKFTVTIPEMIIAEPIQIIPCTDLAVERINGVSVWKY